MPAARMKHDRTSCCSKLDVIPISAAMTVSAGATIEDEIGGITERPDTTKVQVHFFLVAQLRGLRGSFGSDQAVS